MRGSVWNGLLAFGLAISFALTGCAGSLPSPGTRAYAPVEYLLAPGDQLSITVFGEDSLSREYQVSPEGDVSFPLLGDLTVVGMSAANLQTELAERLSNGYLNDPRITVEILNYRPFYVLGEVGVSGRYTYANDLTLEQAIALAGGYSYRANRRQVFIRHAGVDEEKTYEVSPDRRIFIAPGDTIRVGQRYF